jgi:hypothetical protein
MAYYPKSQVKTDLYTNGGQYVLSTTQEEYTGYYYEISTGQKYTGKNPQQGPSILLQKLRNYINDVKLPNSSTPQDSTPLIIYDDDTLIIGDTVYASQVQPSEYYNLTNTFPVRNIPKSNLTLPTDQDKQTGQFTRYFCKKTNENIYLEISKTTYTQLSTNSPEIAWDLYAPVSLLWQMKGDKEQVYKTNKTFVQLIEQRQKWYGFTQFFQDKFLKYYLGL